jgi:putative ABC transport system ATP-binding protein
MTSERSIVVETHNLTKIYGNGAAVYALDDLNLTIFAGEFLTVMGPSGSGKSTLLNMIGALDKPTSGRILVNGEDLATIHDVDRFRAHTVGFVFQLHNLLPALTARENVEVPMHGQDIGEREMVERAKHLLEIVGLGDRMRHLPGQLSGGQRQRVAVARALANNPAIILADEPTGSLDTQSGGEIMDLLETINRDQGTTVLIVTHDPKVARRTRRILTMRDGKVVDDHHVENLVKEDLRELARSRLGELLLNGNQEKLLAEVGLDHLQGKAAAEALRQLLSLTLSRGDGDQ